MGRSVRQAFGMAVHGERSGWLGTGPRVGRFEVDFAAYKGVAPAWTLLP